MVPHPMQAGLSHGMDFRTIHNGISLMAFFLARERFSGIKVSFADGHERHPFQCVFFVASVFGVLSNRGIHKIRLDEVLGFRLEMLYPLLRHSTSFHSGFCTAHRTKAGMERSAMTVYYFSAEAITTFAPCYDGNSVISSAGDVKVVRIFIRRRVASAPSPAMPSPTTTIVAGSGVA